MTSESLDRIMTALSDGDLDEINSTIGEYPELVHMVKPYPLLGMATFFGNIDVVRTLLELGCDPNLHGPLAGQGLPLVKAVSTGRSDIAELLLQHGADANAGRAVISAVVDRNRNSSQLLKLLEGYGADIHRQFSLGGSATMINALSAAKGWGNKEAADYLESKGVTLPEAEVERPIEKGSPDADVIAYFAEHFGPVRPLALKGIVPLQPQIAIHVCPPSQNRDHTTLFTVGMSNHAMQIPQGADSTFEYAELFIDLPGEWPISVNELENREHGWPVQWLQSMATYPSRERTWLGGPCAIVSNGDPPEPLAPNIEFTAMLLLAEKSFTRQDGHIVQLYRLTPLYTEERDLEKRDGMSTLMRAFDEMGVPFVVDPHRMNVAIGE